MKLTFTHRSTSRMMVLHAGSDIQLKEGELRSFKDGDPLVLATYDGETWHTPDGRVWTHIDIEGAP